MHKVLSTKKLDPSLIEQAKKNGIEIIEQAFISIKPTGNNKLPEEVRTLASSGLRFAAFTSANAVRMLDEQMQASGGFYVFDLGIFCLSGKTKEAVLQARCLKPTILGEAENAKILAQEIIRYNVTEIIFFCGNKRREELPALLKEAGIKAREAVVYETIDTPSISVTDMDAVLFFSPSAVQSFFSVNQLKTGTVCFAPGKTTSDSIADFTNNPIIVSESPSQEMMLASVNFYFQNKNYRE